MSNKNTHLYVLHPEKSELNSTKDEDLSYCDTNNINRLEVNALSLLKMNSLDNKWNSPEKPGTW